MKRIENSLVDRWYATIDDAEKFLDFGEHVDINCFRQTNGVREILFENGNTYTVDRVMRETDGDKEREIIERLVECGVEFGGDNE